MLTLKFLFKIFGKSPKLVEIYLKKEDSIFTFEETLWSGVRLCGSSTCVKNELDWKGMLYFLRKTFKFQLII